MDDTRVEQLRRDLNDHLIQNGKFQERTQAGLDNLKDDVGQVKTDMKSLDIKVDSLVAMNSIQNQKIEVLLKSRSLGKEIAKIVIGGLVTASAGGLGYILIQVFKP